MGDKPPGRIEIGIGDGFIEGHLTGARSNPCSAVPWVRSHLRLPIGGNTVCTIIAGAAAGLRDRRHA